MDVLAALPEDVEASALAELRALPDAFGRPHTHGGAGIRQLRSGIYEARLGLHLRAVFTREDDALFVRMIGTHDDVQRYLRSL
ncbi:MAG: hypothetical protein Q7S40_04140 [Opitutaceae bacterium]|nr:hypothetical protein [Opitutaceae bacterium]